jgi:hypothetical protein
MGCDEVAGDKICEDQPAEISECIETCARIH